MTREELVSALREIADAISVEINQPGDNEDRFRALRRAERMARAALEKAGPA